MGTRFIGIIPARYASTRFPGKPLALLQGKPMIQHVCEHVASSTLDQYVVATDDERIYECVRSFGGEVVMTAPSHPSGTDRCGEAARTLQLHDDDVVINIQGDEPFISANEIGLLTGLFDNPAVHIATLVKPIDDPAVATDPNKVKVVTDRDGKALYFSRLPIPRPPTCSTSAYTPTATRPSASLSGSPPPLSSNARSWNNCAGSKTATASILPPATTTASASTHQQTWSTYRTCWPNKTTTFNTTSL